MKRLTGILCVALVTLIGCIGVKEADQTETKQANTIGVEQTIASVPLVLYSGSAGAGVLFENGDRVGMLTAAHLFADGDHDSGNCTYGTKPISVIGFRPGTEKVVYGVGAKILAIDPKKDWAVLELTSREEGMCFSKFADRLPKIGEDVWMVGSPLLDAGTVSKGIVCHPDRKPSVCLDRNLNFIHTDAAGAEGSSGGGLFDTNGICIGIVVRKNPVNKTMYAFSTYYIHEELHGLSLKPELFPPFTE